MSLQSLDTNKPKQKKRLTHRGRLELLYDILDIVRRNSEIAYNTLVLHARTEYKTARLFVDACLDAGLIRATKKRNYRKLTDHISLTPQGYQFLAHFDKICFIAGYKPISERK